MAANPPTLATAQNLTQNFLSAGIIHNGFLSHPWQIVPKVDIPQPEGSLLLSRVSSLAAPGTFSRVGTIPTSATNVDRANFDFARIGVYLDMDIVEENAWSRINDQKQVQVEGAKAGIRRAVGVSITEGSVFPGLKQLTTQQVIAAAGAFNFLELQSAIDLVTASDDDGMGTGANAIFMSLASRRTLIYNLLSQGIKPEWQLSEIVRVPILMWNGLPIYIGNIDDDPPGQGIIYAVKIRTYDCSSGIYLAHSGGDEEGIIVEDLGSIRAETSAYQTSVYMYTVLVLPTVQASAKYIGFGQV